MQKKIIALVIIVVAVVAAGLLLMQKRPRSPVISQPSPSPVSIAASPSTVVPATAEITVTGNEYSFSPSSIDLKAGGTVKINFKNAGKLPHNLTISELNVATKTISGGSEDTISVTAPAAGNYKFFCSVGNHRQLGMEGTLEVK